MAGQTVLVLGGGVAGAATARELRRRLPADHRIIVIDRGGRAALPSTFASLMAGESRLGALTRDRRRLSRRGIEFALAEANAIDFEGRRVRAGGREFRYDYLVLALGPSLSADSVPGLVEAGHNFASLEAAERLGAALRYFTSGRILLCGSRPTLIGPPALYEAAMLLENSFHLRRMRHKVQISVTAPEISPLGYAGREASDLIVDLLAHKGIDLGPGRSLVRVDAPRREAHFEDGGIERFDLLIAVPPRRWPEPLVESGIAGTDTGLSVDPFSMETKIANVFAAGDLIRFGNTVPPATIAVAQHSASVAAAAIEKRIKGQAPPSSRSARGRVFLDVGGGAAMKVEGDFLSGRPLAVRQPSLIWHWARQAYERYCLRQWY